MSFEDIGEYHSKALAPNIRKPKLRSKGINDSPNVTITDEIGYVYEVDDTGEYKRTIVGQRTESPRTLGAAVKTTQSQ